MSMNMPNGAGVARQISSVTNINQGGGEKKAGLYNTVDRRYSSVSATKPFTRTQYDMSRPEVSLVSQARPIGMVLTPAQNLNSAFSGR